MKRPTRFQFDFGPDSDFAWASGLYANGGGQWAVSFRFVAVAGFPF